MWMNMVGRGMETSHLLFAIYIYIYIYELQLDLSCIFFSALR